MNLRNVPYKPQFLKLHSVWSFPNPTFQNSILFSNKAHFSKLIWSLKLSQTSVWETKPCSKVRPKSFVKYSLVKCKEPSNPLLLRNIIIQNSSPLSTIREKSSLMRTPHNWRKHLLIFVPSQKTTQYPRMISTNKINWRKSFLQEAPILMWEHTCYRMIESHLSCCQRRWPIEQNGQTWLE